MKTHKVIDVAMHDTQGVYSGSHAQCIEFVGNQIGYEIVPMTQQEMEVENG